MAHRGRRLLRATGCHPLAAQAVALAFADALILHARTGRWPTTVTVTDPLGTGPLHTRFDHGRFRVWSVGRDGKNDGGFVSWKGKRSDDLVAVYPPIPQKIPPATPPSGFQSSD